MAHSINEWVQRLLMSGIVIITWILLFLGLSFLKILAIILPLFVAVLLLLIVVAPGPRAKPFVERLRNRLR